jgi:D-glycero-D-manno-heptose 1,7-bisphosphate phosphatase
MLDRDGTLIVNRHYLREPEQVEFLPGAIEGLKAMQAQGCALVVITNQSGVARGLLTLADLEAIHERQRQLLAEHGLQLDGVYYCPHGPDDDCNCRKPKTGLAVRAARELGLALAESYVVGDRDIDLQLGRAVGATTVLVRTGYGAETELQNPELADHVVDDLAGLARVIDKLKRPTR